MAIALSCALYVLVALVGCGPEPTASPLVPLPVSPLSSPLMVPSPFPTGPAFTLDPVRAGDDHVTGTGPAGLPIRIVDLSEVGWQIGSGAINEDGNFDIQVVPIVAGHRVGIQINDLSGTSFREEDFMSGPGYSDIPMIGVVFTSALAPPE